MRGVAEGYTPPPEQGLREGFGRGDSIQVRGPRTPLLHSYLHEGDSSGVYTLPWHACRRGDGSAVQGGGGRYVGWLQGCTEVMTVASSLLLDKAGPRCPHATWLRIKHGQESNLQQQSSCVPDAVLIECVERSPHLQAIACLQLP